MDLRMPSTQEQKMGIFRNVLALRIWCALDDVMGKRELEAKISEAFTWKRVAISDTLESQGKR